MADLSRSNLTQNGVFRLAVINKTKSYLDGNDDGHLQSWIDEALANGYTDLVELYNVALAIEQDNQAYLETLPPVDHSETIINLWENEGGVQFDLFQDSPVFLTNDYDATTDKYHIDYTQTIKIRKLYAKKSMKNGYPVKMFHALTFYSGVALWIPDVAELSIALTNDSWRLNPSWQYRRVVLIPKTVDLSQDFLQLVINTLQNAFNIISTFTEGSNPYFIVDLWEKMAFKNTMNDIIIKQNWDNIRKELNEWGY